MWSLWPLLTIIHLVGIIGLWWQESRELFIQLVPLHLTGVTAVALWGTNFRFRNAFLLPLFVIMGGYTLEWVGVHTGFPFGNYQYLEALGPKLLEIPPVIGLNWLLLVITASAMARLIFRSYWTTVIGAASLMTFLDFLIEPLAKEFKFWVFENNLPPWNNYVAWWVASVVFCAVFQKLVKEKNKIELQYLYLLQVGFFVGLHLLKAAF